MGCGSSSATNTEVKHQQKESQESPSKPPPPPPPLKTEPKPIAPQQQAETKPTGADTDPRQKQGATGNAQGSTKTALEPAKTGTGNQPMATSKPTTEAGDHAPGGDEKPKKAVSKQEAQKVLQDLQDKFKELQATIEARIPRKLKVLSGYFDMECPPRIKIVRIFTSSTFTDTMHERNTLMKYGYPELKKHCRKLGYEFQVVDMRWGVRDEATDDHMGSDLCFKELKLCQKISTGPNFVSLLSHKYGFTPNPRVIVEEDFHKIMAEISDTAMKDLFHKWYKKDENHVPTAYILQPISFHLPGFLSDDKEQKKAAKSQWWDESSAMMDALIATTPRVMETKLARNYTMSITEAEVQRGLLTTKDNNKHCLWLKRNIVDIEDQPSSYNVSRYIECTGPEDKWRSAREQLKQLRDVEMTKTLPADRTLQYSIKWHPDSGVDPVKEPKHQTYLNQMCGDFVKTLSAMIDDAVKEREKLEDKLEAEVLQHISFCQTKCQVFHGRDETLEVIRKYLTGTSKAPLVIHGTSGTGKTSIMAKAASMVRKWNSGKVTTVALRFCGTSPDSSSVTPLLKSLVNQIRQAYGVAKAASEDYKALRIEFFHTLLLLGKAANKRRLIVLLDSLDQLSPADNARQLDWIPKTLGEHAKLIVSTLPEQQYECFPALKEKLKSDENMVEVPTLPETEVTGILNKWLDLKQRRLVPAQQQLLVDAFKLCPTPLFLKLSFDQAVRWTSYATPADTVLQKDVKSSIEALFERLETMHGKLMVSKALGYLTAAQNGLTEPELEDILSCDDDVLNDVYMYWTPPVRRLPPLLLVRLKTDLEEYLVERGADGVSVINWYHRQFIEAAQARYCKDDATNVKLHTALADFFAGTWANGKKKPYTSGQGEAGEEDRQLSEQSLQHGDIYNLRKLNNLPYHRTMAGQLQQLKEECLCNYEFLYTKLLAAPLWATLNDYELAREHFPSDEALEMICEALRLSQGALHYDGRQLASQMLGRLEESQSTKEFMESCRTFPRAYMLPNRSILSQPGGQMLHCMAGHKSDIDMMEMSADGSTVLTVCQVDRNVRIWDVKKARMKQEWEKLDQSEKAIFCMDDKSVAIVYDKRIDVRSIATGQLLLKVPCVSHSAVVATGPGKSLLVVFNKTVGVVRDLTEPDKAGVPVKCVEKFKTAALSVIRSSPNFVAVTDGDCYFISVLDVQKSEFYPQFRGFERVKDEDGEWEEFEVEDMVFTPDEKCLIYTNMFTSEILFVDFKTGSTLKSIEGDKDFSYRSLGCSQDGQWLYAMNGDSVRVFNMQTLEARDELVHPKDIVSVKTQDMKTVVTVADDSNIRIWDLTRPKKASQSSNESVLDITSVRTLTPCPNSRYILGTGRRKVGDETVQSIFVYDIETEKRVREFKTDGLGSIHESIPEKKIILCGEGSALRKVNIDTMAVEGRIQCDLPRHTKLVKYLKKSNKLAVVSRGRMNILICDVDSGKIETVMKAGQKQRIEDLRTNEGGTILVCTTDEGPLLVFDLKAKKHLQSIEAKEFETEFYCSVVEISPDGLHLLFSIDKALPGMVEGKDTWDTTHLVVWNFKERKQVCRLFDLELEKKYRSQKDSDQTTSVDEMFFLDNSVVVTSADDFIIRVYNFISGELLHRLTGHSSSVVLRYVPACPYFLSYGSLAEEDTFRLWDKKTFQCVVSYTLDSTVNSVDLSRDGKYVTAFSSKPVDLVRWNVFHGDPHMAASSSGYPEWLSGQELGKTVTVPEEEKTDFGPDLDDDIFEPKSDTEDEEEEEEEEADEDQLEEKDED